MIKKRVATHSFALLLGMLLGGFASARAEQLPVKTYTSADGLGSSFISSLMRDSRGFLWASTRDGLSRFDGSRFVTYQIGGKGAPPGIEQVLEARNGIYWLVTTSGLYRFDPNAPVSDSETHTADRPTLNAEFVSDERGVLYEDHDGNLWCGDSSLFRLEETEKKVSFHTIELNLPSHPALVFRISRMFEGQDRSLWLVTTWGLVRRWPDGKEVFYAVENPRTEALTGYLSASDGRVWIGGGSGIYVLNPELHDELPAPGVLTVRDLDKVTAARTPDDHLTLPQKPGEIFEYSGPERFFGGHIKALCQTRDGIIWIFNGTSLAEFDGQRFHEHQGVPEIVQGPSDVIEDESGNLWLAGSNGLLRFDRGGLTSYGQNDGLKNPSIQLIKNTLDNNLYVVANDLSLSLFDGKSFKTIHPRLSAGAMAIWTANPAFQDSAGEWWFLTSEKLYRFGPVSRFDQLAQQSPRATYDSHNGLKGDYLFHIFEDSRHDLWISTHGVDQANYGLTRWSRTSEQFYTFSEAEGFPPNKAPSSFAEDRDGNLWIGFYEGGLVKFANGRFKEFTPADGLPNGLITTLHLDHQGRVWAGSALSGLFRIDDPSAAATRFISITSENGLASNNVRSITEDNFGNIYAGTARGIDRLSPDGTHIKHYSLSNGLTGDFVASAFCDHSGTLWFGTPNGLSRLVPSPDKVLAAPPVWVSGVRIAGERYPVRELGSAEVYVPEIAHTQNNLQIEFFGLDFNAEEALLYQYKLEGADKDWSAPTLQRIVNFANLAPGPYRFLVRAVNAAGITSVKPAIVSFRILPPFWRRWWFVALMIAVVGIAVLSLDRYRLSRMKQLNAALGQSVLLGTELQKSNRALSLEYEVTQILAEAATPLEAAPRILKAICDSLEWDVGAIWDVNSEANVLRCVSVWHQPVMQAPEFEAITMRSTFPPGVGLPGRVWATAETLWIGDLAQETNFPRVDAASNEGLRSGFGFPVLLGSEVIGVLEFFKRQQSNADPDLLQLMSLMGARIGQLLVHKQSEQSVRESETRFRTLAETASDAIITIDEKSTIIYVNQAAEQIFGHTVAQMVGADLTMLMPEYFRHLHRAGISRYVTTGKRHLGWQAIELPGLHQNGHEIPLELSFGEFTKDDRRYFTGIVRDITERKRAEAALQRAREERLQELELVRKRIATDLHDDIGSSLTQISILSEVARQRIGHEKSTVAEPLGLIATSSRELVDAMSDIVWAINPERDHLSDLTGRMRRFASDVFTARNIEFRIRIPGTEEDIPVGANMRRELFLIFKESINNIVKHSACTEAEVEFRVENDQLTLKLSDNGKGFDTTNESDGHGLMSMRERARSLGAQLEFVSDNFNGTTVMLKVPLGQANAPRE